MDIQVSLSALISLVAGVIFVVYGIVNTDFRRVLPAACLTIGLILGGVTLIIVVLADALGIGIHSQSRTVSESVMSCLNLRSIACDKSIPFSFVMLTSSLPIWFALKILFKSESNVDEFR